MKLASKIGLSVALSMVFLVVSQLAAAENLLPMGIELTTLQGMFMLGLVAYVAFGNEKKPSNF